MGYIYPSVGRRREADIDDCRRLWIDDLAFSRKIQAITHDVMGTSQATRTHNSLYWRSRRTRAEVVEWIKMPALVKRFAASQDHDMKELHKSYLFRQNLLVVTQVFLIYSRRPIFCAW
jgi:hypothetical protein